MIGVSVKRTSQQNTLLPKRSVRNQRYIIRIIWDDYFVSATVYLAYVAGVCVAFSRRALATIRRLLRRLQSILVLLLSNAKNNYCFVIMKHNISTSNRLYINKKYFTEISSLIHFRNQDRKQQIINFTIKRTPNNRFLFIFFLLNNLFLLLIKYNRYNYTNKETHRNKQKIKIWQLNARHLIKYYSPLLLSSSVPVT